MEEALRYGVVEEGSDSCARGGEPFDEGENGLGHRDPVREVVLGIQSLGEPVAKPFDYPGWAEDEAVSRDGGWEGGDLLLGVLQGMSSVFWVASFTFSWSPLLLRVRKRPWRRRMLVWSEGEATVSEKSAT